MEQRGCVKEPDSMSQPVDGRSPMKKAKPFCISKKEVWEAYQRVKANKGAAGTDGQTIEDFERKLKKNLYRIWNRMSSGSYFPPPVRTVKIPKKSGGERSLGIPTVNADCTGPQFGFGMGGDLSSVSPTSRPAL
jgi:RNA-directed DNA polymerase